MKHFFVCLLRALTMVALMAGSLSLTGCPQVARNLLPIIKDVMVEILDAEQKLDLVDSQASAWFKLYPNAALEDDWRLAVDRTRATLDVAIKLAHGAEELSVSDHQAAFAQFALAWQELMELATSIGVVGKDGVFGAGPLRGVKLDPPLALAVAPPPPVATNAPPLPPPPEAAETAQPPAAPPPAPQPEPAASPEPQVQP